MGIIQKQAIKGTIYTYLGVALGFINTALLMPKMFLTEEIGLLSILVSISVIFAQSSSLGFSNVTTKFFPKFRNNDQNHNGFLFIALVVFIFGSILSIITLQVLKPYLIDWYIEKSPLLIKYLHYLIPLIILFLLYTIVDNYNKVLYNATLGIFLKEFVLRIINTAIIILYFFDFIDFDWFVFYYVMAYSVLSIVIIISLLIKKQISFKPNFSFLTKDLRKQIINVGIYGIIAGFSGIIIINIDRIMINHIIQSDALQATGIYSISFFFSTIILMPSRALRKISSVIVSDSFNKNNLDEINIVYQKSSITQFIIGLWIFIGIWVNIDNIFDFLPPEYIAGKYVVLFIGISNLVDMGSGISTNIIMYSKYYRFQTYFIILFMIMIVISNIIFIPLYGITGAAIASMVSMSIFTIIKFLFLYKKFNFQPYSFSHIFAIAIAFTTYAICYLIPDNANLYVDVSIKSSIISIVYYLLIYYTKISDDINSNIYSAIKRIQGKLN